MPITSVRGVTAPNPQFPKATANRPAPIQEGARSRGRDFRVGVVVLFEESFVWVANIKRGRDTTDKLAVQLHSAKVWRRVIAGLGVLIEK